MSASVDPARITAALAARQGGFPHEALSWLAAEGLTSPGRVEGLLRHRTDGPPGLYEVLVAVGRGDLAAGRLYEGHVDALGLLRRLGTSDQRAWAQAVAERGGLLGVWGADDPSAPARIAVSGGTARLSGRKTYTSGGAQVALAVVAAKNEAGMTQLVLLDRDRLEGRFDESWWEPVGMAETRSDQLDLAGLDVSDADLLGDGGAYEGHPAFGAGAVRFVAVQVGGLLGVWDAMRGHLGGADRAGDPHQAARLAAAVSDCEAAYRLTASAFDRLRPLIDWSAERPDGAGDAGAADAARLFVEAAGQRVIDLAVRSVGCGGLMRRHPLSRRVTDLMVYLRQPAPDAAAMRLGRAAGEARYVPSFDEPTRLPRAD